jgi:hypothetical protein
MQGINSATNKTRRLVGSILIYLTGFVLIGSAASKFAHVPKVVSELSAMGFEGNRLMMIAALEAVSALLFLIHRIRSAGLLLVSAWARRATFLWASVPLLAIGIVEKIAFNTSHFAVMLERRMGGGVEAVTAPGGVPMDPMTHLTPMHFLSSPGLWIGLALTAAFLAAAVRLRRYQGPI